MANEQPQVKLLIFDFDGTALGGHEPYAQFPPDFCVFLDKLTERGVRWVTNSGWAVRGQLEVVRASTVRSSPAFLIGETGREIAVMQNGSAEHDAAYAAFIREQDRSFRQRNGESVHRVARTLLDTNHLTAFLFDFSHRNLLHCKCDGRHAESVKEIVQPLVEGGEFYLLDSLGERYSCTLLPSYMNKGDPTRVVQRKLGIDAESTVFAGDDTNDLPMFQPHLARYLVCPANAHATIRQRVEELGGIVARRKYSWGIIEGVSQLVGLV
jgi:HAD superfamily hydrolase (TIGR01484 family)